MFCMKMKHILAGTLVAGLLLTSPLHSVAAATEAQLLVNPILAELHLDAPVSADENGNVSLPEDGSLLDICFPSRLGETVIDTIAPEGFRGCGYFRSVFLPVEIVKIGDNAFADCEGLEYIVLIGRQNTNGMILGENWSGNATVVFGLVQQETEPATEEAYKEEPAAETLAATEPVQEEPTEETECTEETVPEEATTETESDLEEPAEETECTEETVPEESTMETESDLEGPAEETKNNEETVPVESATATAEETVHAEATEESVAETTGAVVQETVLTETVEETVETVQE